MPEIASKAKERRVKRLELRALDDAGQFEGLAAVYGVVDDFGDIIEPGAFTRTIQHKGGKVPILWQHDPREPIGIGVLADNALGLGITGKMNLDVARARETHSLMKQARAEGVPFGLSIGFDTIQADWKGAIRHVKEIRLWEVSPTLFPAQALATVASVKAGGQQAEGKPFGPFESFDDCVAQSQDKDDPEAFCAFLEHQASGGWPEDEALRMRAIAHGIAEAVGALRDVIAEAQRDQVQYAIEQFDQGISTLRALIDVDPTTSASNLAALASLSALLHEMDAWASNQVPMRE